MQSPMQYYLKLHGDAKKCYEIENHKWVEQEKKFLDHPKNLHPQTLKTMLVHHSIPLCLDSMNRDFELY